MSENKAEHTGLSDGDVGSGDHARSVVVDRESSSESGGKSTVNGSGESNSGGVGGGDAEHLSDSGSGGGDGEGGLSSDGGSGSGRARNEESWWWQEKSVKTRTYEGKTRKLTSDEGYDSSSRLRSVVRGGEGNGSTKESEEGVVTGLNGEDRSSNSDQGRSVDSSSGSKVGGHSDSLNDLGKGEEGGNAGVGEVVGARLDWGDAGGGDRSGEESDVVGLIGGNLLEESVNSGVTGLDEVSVGVLRESLGVEVVCCGGGSR